MLRVILPLTKPALTVVALFTFMNAWNDYLGPLIYLRREEQYVLALGLENLRQTIVSVGATALAYPYLMAVSTIITAAHFDRLLLHPAHLHRRHFAHRTQRLAACRSKSKNQMAPLQKAFSGHELSRIYTNYSVTPEKEFVLVRV